MIDALALLSSSIVHCTNIILIVNLSASLCNPSPVLPIQGHPHHHREDQASRVTVHPCELDLRTLAGPKVLPAASDGCLPVHDHLAGGSLTKSSLAISRCP